MDILTPQTWPNVLLVEDNPVDVMMVKLALEKAGYPKELKVVDDGVPALAFLRRESPYEKEERPDLVILDLNLKRIDGPEVLGTIRNTPELAQLIVAVLSSSPEDVMKARAPRADCFFRKSASLDAYVALGSRLMQCYARRSGQDRT